MGGVLRLTSQYQVTSKYFLASGASVASGVYTVTSGYTNVFDILVYPISGGPPASSSGLTIGVFDAISGLANVNSGFGLWSYAFGSQSGLTGGLPPSIPPITGPLTMIALSGVVVQTGAGWVVNVVYSK